MVRGGGGPGARCIACIQCWRTILDGAESPCARWWVHRGAGGAVCTVHGAGCAWSLHTEGHQGWEDDSRVLQSLRAPVTQGSLVTGIPGSLDPRITCLSWWLVGAHSPAPLHPCTSAPLYLCTSAPVHSDTVHSPCSVTTAPQSSPLHLLHRTCWTG